MIDTPSTSERETLRALLAETIQTGDITLASGRKTNFYFDGRLATLDPRGLDLISRISCDRLAGRCDAVGGPTAAAVPMLSGIGLASLALECPFKTFFTRKEAKGHGMGHRIEGPPLRAGERVFIVDDTATSGGSLLQSAEVVRQETEATVVGALVIVDREEGAREKLAAAEIPLEALFVRSDFL